MPSIYPMIRFLKWRPDLNENKLPEIAEDEFSRIRRYLNLELAGIGSILVVAPMMTHGIGM